MKKLWLFFIPLIALLAFSKAYAHPPSDIKIIFNPDTRILQAVIFHNVKNTLNHYIKQVNVGLNGKQIISHHISRQDNNETQTVEYLVPDAKAGDVITVEGQCSIAGKLKKGITVKSK